MDVDARHGADSGWSRVATAGALGGALGMVGGMCAAVLVSVVAGFLVLGDGVAGAIGLVLLYASIGSIIGALLGCVLGAVIGLALGALRIERYAPPVSALVGVLVVLGLEQAISVGALAVSAGFGAIGWGVGALFAAGSTPPEQRTGRLRARFC
ncbi:MAG: hypothetical protein AAF962_15405 [Actinomycetota bacterium]